MSKLQINLHGHLTDNSLMLAAITSVMNEFFTSGSVSSGSQIIMSNALNDDGVALEELVHHANLLEIS